MANIVINPPVDSTAIPLNAAPLVQPRAICAPNPNNTPPPKAKTSLRLLVIFGECWTLQLILPLKPPDINAPINRPSVSNTSQVFIGDSSSFINLL